MQELVSLKIESVSLKISFFNIRKSTSQISRGSENSRVLDSTKIGITFKGISALKKLSSLTQHTVK
jgi:hypothetical protein